MKIIFLHLFITYCAESSSFTYALDATSIGLPPIPAFLSRTTR